MKFTTVLKTKETFERYENVFNTLPVLVVSLNQTFLYFPNTHSKKTQK